MSLGGSYDLMAELLDDLASPELHVLTIEHHGRVVGSIEWQAEEEPMFIGTPASTCLWDPAVHGSGLGTDAVHTLVRHLIDAKGHHRLVVDPAAGNTARFGNGRPRGRRDAAVRSDRRTVRGTTAF